MALLDYAELLNFAVSECSDSFVAGVLRGMLLNLHA